jgi:hypothetical protein
MSAVPVHTAIATTISPWVIDRIDKRRRAFLWKGAATVSGGAMSPRVAEGLQTTGTGRGGLGFPNLEFMGYALKLRWLWLRKIDPHRPWAMLPDIYGREAGTRCVSFLHLHHCWRWIQHIVLFWVDRWLQGMSCLIKAVGPRIQKCRTVKEALTNRRWVRDIKGALTVQVLLDYLSLSIWERLRQVTLNDEPDQFRWRRLFLYGISVSRLLQWPICHSRCKVYFA